MANSRLLQMYGFAEQANQHDDVHIEKATIIEAMKEMSGEDKCEAADAKIKLLDSLGFFDEGKKCSLQNKWTIMCPYRIKIDKL